MVPLTGLYLYSLMLTSKVQAALCQHNFKFWEEIIIKIENQYAIKNEEDERYLSTIYVGTKNYVTPLSWAYTETQAKHFSTKEEAQATIDFIGAVIDWELEEHLQIIITKH